MRLHQWNDAKSRCAWVIHSGIMRKFMLFCPIPQRKSPIFFKTQIEKYIWYKRLPMLWKEKESVFLVL